MKRSGVIKGDGVWKFRLTRTNAPWFPPFDNKGSVSWQVQEDTRTFVNESFSATRQNDEAKSNRSGATDERGMEEAVIHLQIDGFFDWDGGGGGGMIELR